MENKVFNSTAQADYLELTAPYYNAIYDTMVSFEVENISVFVNSLGHVEFYDHNERSLGFVDYPAAESPDMYAHSGQYGTVRCSSDGEKIRIQLPVYEWLDSYPHCDGESDRWTRRTLRWFDVVFDCKTRQINVEGK